MHHYMLIPVNCRFSIEFIATFVFHKIIINILTMKFLYLAFLLLAGISAFPQQQVLHPSEVKQPVYFDVSPPLRDMVKMLNQRVDATWKDGIVKNYFNVRNHDNSVSLIPNFLDPRRQDYFGTTLTDTTIQNFEGVGAGAYIPPDTDGDVGPDHYFQVVNCSYAIYNKSGLKVLGPLGSSSVWAGMPNNSNDGDAVVLYDEIADRWLFTQFSLPNYPNGPFYQMIAISQTPDPTGSWYRYQYSFTSMPDYPKFGIWPDGYYMTCNRFGPGSGGYAGTGAAAFDRTLMLAGDPSAQMVWFALPGSNEAYSMLPSDCDGEFPPMGTPNYFTYMNSGNPHLGILEFSVNWSTPLSSTLGNLLSLPVTTFSSNLGGGIPQLGTTYKLATLSDRLMYRLQFRKFNDHWSMLCNHSVNVGSNVAGIRWYELRKTTGAWAVYQESTYAPADGKSRWMGSIAMDSAGNIALGYSISSSTMYPSIRYTGRMSSDPVNQMTVAERGIMDGTGCQQSSTRRWGDYSSMRVDASAPTTFWYTTEYYSMSSSSNWQTRIASFSFTNDFTTFATAGPVNVCIGDSSQLNAEAYGGSGNYTYAWTSIPPGFTSNQKHVKVAPSDTTTYIAVISDGVQTHHDTTQVRIIFPPTVSAGNDTTVCSYLPSVVLHGTASNYRMVGWATSGNGYFLSQDTLTTTYVFGTVDYALGSVNIALIAFPISPCSGNVNSQKHIVLDPCTGIGETAMTDVDLIIRPNPAKGSATLTLNGMQNKPGKLTLTSPNGQELLTLDLPASETTLTRQLDLNEYPAGIYFLKVRSDKQVITKELVIY
jgi:hypothetical protein